MLKPAHWLDDEQFDKDTSLTKIKAQLGNRMLASVTRLGDLSLLGQLLHLDWATFYSKLPVTLVLAKEELKRFFYNVHRFAF